MMNKSVIMSDALHFRVDYPINPYYADGSVDAQTAQVEHDSIRSALISAGVNVITIPSPADSQDGVYTANWALVRNGKAVLARLPEVRRSEEDYAKRKLEGLGIEVVEVPNGMKFSGQGDALAFGNYLLSGKNYRSDEAAQAFAAKELGYDIVQLETVPQLDSDGNAVVNKSSGWQDSFFYDIDLALAVIDEPRNGKNGILAYCPEAFTEESRAIIESLEGTETIKVSLAEAREAFALNLVSTGETVVMSAEAPKLAKELASRGYKVVTPKITELSKGGGYIRCTSLTIVN